MWSIILNDFEHGDLIYETVNECFNFYKHQTVSKEMYIIDQVSNPWICFKYFNSQIVQKDLQDELYNEFIIGEFTHL